MEQGWIYILVNSSIPGMAKVGRTTRPPADRAAELSAATGVATPFILAFDQRCADCAEAERLVHAELDRRGLRIAPNREFFRGPISEMVRVMIDIGERSGAAPPAGPDLSAQRLRLAGDRALFGRGDTLQDTGEAMRCYKLAASRGSLIAFERLGHIYVRLYLGARHRAGRRRALSALKEGARRGNYYCYCELGVLFAADRHIANFEKSWDLFFARRADSFNADIEMDEKRFAQACRVYITCAIDLDGPRIHLAELCAASEPILAACLAQLAHLRDQPEARLRAVRALRWTYQNLFPQPALPPRRKLGARLLHPWAAEADTAPA
jgi:hypothetical protein